MLASLSIEREEVKSVWCSHVHLPGYINETVELPLPHMNWFSVCDVSYGKCSLLVSVSLWLMRQSVVQRCTLLAFVNAR